MVKTEIILTRGVPSKSKRKLERIAKKRRCSVNLLLLHAIDFYLNNAIEATFPDK